MKLNPDCIRDILLYVEDTSNFDIYTNYDSSNIPDELSEYTHDEIVYHIRQCQMSDLITKVSYYDCGSKISIKDLTPRGHEFLANIESDSLWNTTKEISGKIGSRSLQALIQIATGVITATINKQLGI